MATSMLDDPIAPPAKPAADPSMRTHVGELISFLSALALLLVMFATAWYGVAGVPDPSAARPAVSSTQDAWNALPVTRWVLLATILTVLVSVALHASQRRHGGRTQTSGPIAALGALSALLLVVRVLIDLPGGGTVIDQKLGAVIGLFCALGIAFGGWESVREDHRAAAQRRSRS